MKRWVFLVGLFVIMVACVFIAYLLGVFEPLIEQREGDIQRERRSQTIHLSQEGSSILG